MKTKGFKLNPQPCVIKGKAVMDSAAEDFYIIGQIDEKEKHIRVVTLETSDGVPYYSCQLGDIEITQLRNEIYGKWEQLWGELDEKTVQDLGKQIEEKITPR